MISHYFKIAFRNLKKQKGLTLINIFGLSIGIACFSLFLLFAINEFNYDRFHKNSNSIYRVYRWHKASNGEDPNGDSSMPMPLGPALKTDFSDVISYVRMVSSGDCFVKTEKGVSRIEVSYSDP